MIDFSEQTPLSSNYSFPNTRILIKGAGDLATGVAARLSKSGFAVAMTELALPSMVRRSVSFGSAVYEGQIEVEGVKAVKSTLPELEAHLGQGYIPILIDALPDVISAYQPAVFVDAVMAKRNTGTDKDMAPLVIALGPGFSAGDDCHLVIETNRGHWLGRIIERGPAQPNTGQPGAVQGQTHSRVLRAPVAGHLMPQAEIGALLKAGDVIGTIGQTELSAPFNGVLRGLIHPAVPLTPGFKIGDLDPRSSVEHCFTISDKAYAIAGGVLEAVLRFSVQSF